MTLATFIKLLDDRGFVDLDSIPNEDEVGFLNRLRTQKYVYLAKYYGLSLPFTYSIYRYGPYSSSLARAYYSLAVNGEQFNQECTVPLPNTFNQEKFLNLISDKDEAWLEIATTLLDQKSRFVDYDDLIGHVETIKCDYSVDYITHVLTNLIDEKLIS